MTTTPYISVILPSIRPFLLRRAYDSIAKGCIDLTFEMIVISPYDLPEELLNVKNVRLIKDKGCPARCAQLGLISSSGQMVTLLSDDCTPHYSSYCDIDKNFKSIDAPQDKKFVGLKYSEGQSMHTPDYWRAKSHEPLKLDGLKEDMPVSSMIYMTRQGLINMGGWDCSVFECINWGGHDLTARMLNAGYKFMLTAGDFAHVDWGPGVDGMYNDHRPLWESDYEGMQNMRKFWYKTNPDRVAVDLNSWQKAEPVWSRRFK
jgi:hypothetical protein